MLEDLRNHIKAAMAPAEHVTLATSGPAGLQAGRLPAEVAGLRIYILAPRTSEHLVNVERNPQVLVTEGDWQARGHATARAPADCPPGLRLLARADAPWSVVLEVTPTRVQIGRNEGWGYRETFDL